MALWQDLKTFNWGPRGESLEPEEHTQCLMVHIIYNQWRVPLLGDCVKSSIFEVLNPGHIRALSRLPRITFYTTPWCNYLFEKLMADTILSLPFLYSLQSTNSIISTMTTGNFLVELWGGLKVDRGQGGGHAHWVEVTQNSVSRQVQLWYFNN